MKKLRYTLRVLSGASFDKLARVIDQAHEKSGKSKLYIFFDILRCALLHGAGYYDYVIFAFYQLNHRQRKSYVTRFRNKKIISLCNDPQYSEIFNHKGKFDRRFRRYLKRAYLDLAETSLDQFVDFMKERDVIFAKPYVGESGKGIEKLTKSDFASLAEMYAYLTAPEKHFGLIEEQIVQHEALSRLYPLSINTLRIVTIVAGGKAHCVYVVAKMGDGGKFVDNLENGGVCCPVDQKTGKLCGVGHTSRLVNFDCHPYTGVPFIGYQLPYVKEAVELCLEAAMEIEQVRFVGWDVCIMPDGPAIIEGNDYPGYDFWQLPEHTPDKIGLYPYYQSLLDEL